MNNKILIGVIGIVAAVALILGVLAFTSSPALSASGTGPTHYQRENFLQGLFAGTAGQFSLDNAGNASTTGTLAATGVTTLTTLIGSTSTLGNTTLGNGVLALTDSASLTAAQFCGNGIVTITTSTNPTVTLPVATSTFAACMTNLGGSRSITIYNTSSTASTLTIASTTGITMVKPFNVSSTFTVLGGGAANIKLTQITSSTALVSVDRLQ